MTATSARQDVADILLGEEPEWDDVEVVDIDRTTADRYLRRIAHLDSAHLDEAAAVQAQVDELQRWLRARYEGYMAQRGWLSARLQRFHEALLSADPRIKTVKLPAGELRMRAQQPSWTFDALEFVPWAREHAPDLVRTIPESQAVDVAAAKKSLMVAEWHDTDGATETNVVSLDGEAVPGVTIEQRDPKFSLVVGADDGYPCDEARDAQHDAITDLGIEH